MADRPMRFSAPMVRALLAGTKTQTRRVVKPCKDPDYGCQMAPGEIAGDEHPERLSPYGQPGDRLWVREAWKAHTTFDHLPPRDIPQSHVWYMADDGYKAESRFRQGMFMPRWASRITLEVTGVRVERLQDISEADAVAEGCHGPEDDIDSKLPDCPQCGGVGLYMAFNPSTGGALPDTDCRMCDTPAKRYRLLWEQINGPGSWDANPWVWCVEFKRVQP